MKINNKLKQIRRGMTNLSQEELANLVGCTRQTIVALEKNKYNPSLILALRIAKELNHKVEDIFELTSDD